MTTKTIKETEEHIKSGIRMSAHYCPVANALNDAGFKGAGVCSSDWRFENRTGYIPLPSEVGERIRRFDATGKMEPFEFEVSVD
jgi:hypothetical protein